MPLNADLHSHSCASDGVLAPSDVAARARANGVQVWALTDHDETRGLAEAAQAASALGMVFVPGVEISVTWAGHTVHVLGLNIDPADTALAAGLAQIRQVRRDRARRISDLLAAHGIHRALQGALSVAGNPALIGRLHFARFLVEQGHCRTTQQAFDRYLGEGRRAYVPVRWTRLKAALGWIHGAGGKAVIAHPWRHRHDANQQTALFDTFKDLGGEGLEVLAGPRAPARHDAYVRLAQHYGFEGSRGSDFHAPGAGHFDLGRMPDLPASLTPVWHDWV
ncbi:PHP domain-containing protein [Castellaniella sp.]|uniref:PHP domain-containing protein n=1 Tax=Castellaniella sp. TaxID=1955812 RepID=UPI003563DF97